MARVPGENPVVKELESNIIQDNMLTEDEKRAFGEAFAKDKYGVLTASHDRQGKLRDFILKDIRAHVEQAIGPEKVRQAQQFFNARNTQKNKEGKRNIPMIAEDAIFGPNVMRQVVNYQIEKGFPVTGVLDAQLMAQIESDMPNIKSKPVKQDRVVERPGGEKGQVQPGEQVSYSSEDLRIIQGLEKHTLANLRSALRLDRSDKPFDTELQKAVKSFQESYNIGKSNGFLSIFGKYTPPDRSLNARGIPDKRTQSLIFALKNPLHIPS